MVPRLRLPPARVRASHFLLLLGSAILQLAVPLVPVKAGSPAAFPYLAKAMETGSRPVAAAVSLVARSSPALACFALVPCRWPIGFGIADLVIAAADPFSLAGSDLACSVVGSVCSFAVETGKERAVVGISCSLTPRSSS